MAARKKPKAVVGSMLALGAATPAKEYAAYTVYQFCLGCDFSRPLGSLPAADSAAWRPPWVCSTCTKKGVRYVEYVPS